MLPACPMCRAFSQATPLGQIAKQSTKARNTMLMVGIAVLIAGDLSYAYIRTQLGEPVAIGAGCPARSVCADGWNMHLACCVFGWALHPCQHAKCTS